jgi:hypothetical protein
MLAKKEKEAEEITTLKESFRVLVLLHHKAIQESSEEKR